MSMSSSNEEDCWREGEGEEEGGWEWVELVTEKVLLGTEAGRGGREDCVCGGGVGGGGGVKEMERGGREGGGRREGGRKEKSRQN